MTVTKYTSDAANGGQICLTEETYRQLPARSLLRRAWVLHMGQHHLGDYYTAVDDDDCEFQLYQVGARRGTWVWWHGRVLRAWKPRTACRCRCSTARQGRGTLSACG